MGHLNGFVFLFNTRKVNVRVAVVKVYIQYCVKKILLKVRMLKMLKIAPMVKFADNTNFKHCP